MCWKTYLQDGAAGVLSLQDTILVSIHQAEDLVPLFRSTFIGGKTCSPKLVETCVFIRCGSTSRSYTDVSLSSNPKFSIASVGFVFPSFPTTHSGATPRTKSLFLGAIFQTERPCVKQTLVCRRFTQHRLPISIVLVSLHKGTTCQK
jgi:hypothetical protein